MFYAEGETDEAAGLMLFQPRHNPQPKENIIEDEACMCAVRDVTRIYLGTFLTSHFPPPQRWLLAMLLA